MQDNIAGPSWAETKARQRNVNFFLQVKTLKADICQGEERNLFLSSVGQRVSKAGAGIELKKTNRQQTR